MRMVILTVLFFSLSAPAFAYRTPKPAKITEFNKQSAVQLNNDLENIWDLTNGRYSFDVSTTAPNGNIRGIAGDALVYNNSGELQFWINDGTGNKKVWQEILAIPMGEINYFDTTGTSVTISAQSDGTTNMVKVAPTTTLNNDNGFDNGGANNGRLRYIGTVTKMFHIACTISFSPVSANDTFVVGVAKNGTVLTASKILQKVTNPGDTQSTALHVMTSLATNDYLELYVGNTTDTDNFTIKTLTLFAMGM